MKKVYIFMTENIHPIGGMQLLTSGKAKVLERQGWEVIIFFPAFARGHCAIEELDKYDTGGMLELSLPPYKWPRTTRKKVIRKMCGLIGAVSAEDTIIIESHVDRLCQWGELLAAEIHVKHMIFACNETYRGKGKYYAECLEFFDWKHKRKELVGENSGMFDLLFEGFKEVPLNEVYIFMFDENPVRDVKNKLVEEISSYDWNIGYIGRLEKGYVPNIIQSVATFAKWHKNKRIQFIIVGDITSRKDLIRETFKECSNVYINELGNVVPIPKSLFNKLDAVIAGSGSAKCAAYEGVYTILADADNFRSNGVYGYDTSDHLYCGQMEQTSFEESLEKVLVKKEYENRQSNLPPYMNPEECTKQNFELIEASSQNMEYYPEDKLCVAKINYAEIAYLRIYAWLHRNLPPSVRKQLRKFKRKLKKK